MSLARVENQMIILYVACCNFSESQGVGALHQVLPSICICSHTSYQLPWRGPPSLVSALCQSVPSHQ